MQVAPLALLGRDENLSGTIPLKPTAGLNGAPEPSCERAAVFASLTDSVSWRAGALDVDALAGL